jgi:hypothetical protein
VRQKLFIFFGLILLAILLVGLNAASYVQKETVPDDETRPNRSTYNTGATGTRAFFDLLAETGRKPVRWQEPPSALLTGDPKNKPQTFVVVGATRREFSDEEVEKLLRWVADGGRLVLIDREPHSQLLSTTANWSVKAVPTDDLAIGVDPSNQQQMTDKTVAAKPVQPTVFTRAVNAVQPSRFASSVTLEFYSPERVGNFTVASPAPTPRYGGISSNTKEFTVATPTPAPVFEDDSYAVEPPPKPKNKAGESAGDPPPAARSDEEFKIGEQNSASVQIADETIETPSLNAPVVHLANDKKSLLVDMPYGAGEVVFLTDPYIVSNAGIRLVDNAQLAVNIVAARGGTIAFDEYHQGYGANENRLLAYFSGTPLLAILGQIALVIFAVLFTQSRRFARALPPNEPNRLSKLEYVSAMAELQQRTRAYDLALENIYSEFRRRAARFVGADNFQTPRRELAQMLAEKADLNARELEELMFKCEEIIHGEPANRKEVLRLAARLREIEEKIGLKRRRVTRKGM